MYEERAKRVFMYEKTKNEMETTRECRRFDDNSRIDAFDGGRLLERL